MEQFVLWNITERGVGLTKNIEMFIYIDYLEVVNSIHSISCS